MAFLKIPEGYIWDDLRFPANTTRPGAGAGTPGQEAATGLLLFSSITLEAIYGVAQMPHSWREGSMIYPHVHWQKTTSAAGGVYWQLSYDIVNNGDVAPMTYATGVVGFTPVAGTPDNDTANECLITALGTGIDMTGFTVSCLIFWNISRRPAAAQDTYGADARMIEWDIHYEQDAPGGSFERFSKHET